jgi:hypothetical protein
MCSVGFKEDAATAVLAAATAQLYGRLHSTFTVAFRQGGKRGQVGVGVAAVAREYIKKCFL